MFWACSWWGLPCRFPLGSRGGLLPHRFALTGQLALPGGVFSVALSLSRRDARRLHLAATIPCGARTFLGHREVDAVVWQRDKHISQSGGRKTEVTSTPLH